MNSQQLVPQRMKEARGMLGLSQEEAAAQGELHQPDISELERLEKPHLPVRYLAFLYRKGIDLNSLFSEGPTVFRAGFSMAAEPQAPYGRKRPARDVLREMDELKEMMQQLLDKKKKPGA